MSMTAWRFRGTEGADEAVLMVKQLTAQDQIDVQDATVIRWPQYSTVPLATEHVTDEGGGVSTRLHKLRTGRIDSSMLEAVKSDLTPGTSALVLMSSDAAVDTVARAFQGHPMELIRSDLSVQQQDALRAAFGDLRGGGGQPRPPIGPR